MIEATEARRTADERLAAGERLLSLSECATRLRMKRPNVAKFLARRGVEPAFPKAQGYMWWSSDIDRVKAEREADEGRMASDAQRRETALARAHPEPLPRLSDRQSELLLEMLRRPIAQLPEDYFTLNRMRKRGWCETVEPRVWALTAAGRDLAGRIS